VRVSAGLVGGHIHPSLCVTPGGDLVAVFNRGPGDADELLLTRSSDSGRHWTAPTVIPSSVERCPNGVYPGALTVLRSGEILLHWHRYGPTPERRWELGPEYCVSTDDGHTFSEPILIDTPLRPEGQATQPEGRFPFLELDDDTWVLPQYDRTVAYSRSTGALAEWGDGRIHGMVPIVRTPTGTLLSGAPQTQASVPVDLDRRGLCWNYQLASTAIHNYIAKQSVSSCCNGNAAPIYRSVSRTPAARWCAACAARTTARYVPQIWPTSRDLAQCFD
jgi:hypothetical protein